MKKSEKLADERKGLKIHSHSTILCLGILIALAGLVSVVWWPIMKIKGLMK